MFGYGYAQARLRGARGRAGAYYLVAVVMHGSFNALASLGAIVAFLGFSTTISDYAALIGLGLVFVYAFAAIEHARGLIHETDRPLDGRFRPPYRGSLSPPKSPVYRQR